MSFVLYIVYVRNVSRDIWHVFNKILFSFRARLCVASPILVLAALLGLVLFELFKRSTLCLPCQIHILLSLLLVLLLVAVVARPVCSFVAVAAFVVACSAVCC